MENIGQFLNSCYDYGLEKNDVFQTVDLYDNTNIPQVSHQTEILPLSTYSLTFIMALK